MIGIGEGVGVGVLEKLDFDFLSTKQETKSSLANLIVDPIFMLCLLKWSVNINLIANLLVPMSPSIPLRGVWDCVPVSLYELDLELFDDWAPFTSSFNGRTDICRVGEYLSSSNWSRRGRYLNGSGSITSKVCMGTSEGSTGAESVTLGICYGAFVGASRWIFIETRGGSG